MALDKVVGGIEDSARKEAGQLVDEAEREKAALLQQANEAMASKKDEKKAQLAEATRRLRQQEISSAELEAKRIVLNAKKEVLDRTLEETMGELGRLGDAERSRLYARILAKGTKIIPMAKVYCPKGEGKMVSSTPGVGSVVETEMGPGLILESMDGMILLDYRFKTILEDLWEKELKNVSNILFG